MRQTSVSNGCTVTTGPKISSRLGRANGDKPYNHDKFTLSAMLVRANVVSKANRTVMTQGLTKAP